MNWKINTILSKAKRLRSTFRLSHAIFLVICISLTACEEFLEESIEGKSVILLSPGNQAELPSYNINFMWENMEHANAYRLQVAKPDFDSLQLIFADTIVERTQFGMSLEPGAYQWRVQGLNGSSEGAYVVRSFVIYESDLRRQLVLLDTPADHYITSEASISYAWQQLYGATSYRIQLDTNAFQDESRIMLDSVTMLNAFRMTMTSEGEFQWRVRAESDTSTSAWSAVRSLVYDHTPPATPVLSSPGNNSTVNRPVTLRWDAIADADHYLLYVYKADSTTLFSAAYPTRQIAVSHNFNHGNLNERLLWRVRAVDRAGNASEFSPYRSFVLGN